MFSRVAASRSMSVALLLVAGSVAGCGVAAVAGSAAPAQTTTMPAAVEVTVPCETFDAASVQARDVQVAVGQQIVVTLCSNASTGFSWQPANVPAAIVKLLDQAAAPASNAEGAQPVVGAAGTETLTFQAVASGTGDVGLEYSQPWSGGTKGAWRLTVHVAVA